MGRVQPAEHYCPSAACFDVVPKTKLLDCFHVDCYVVLHNSLILQRSREMSYM